MDGQKTTNCFQVPSLHVLFMLSVCMEFLDRQDDSYNYDSIINTNDDEYKLLGQRYGYGARPQSNLRLIHYPHHKTPKYKYTNKHQGSKYYLSYNSEGLSQRRQNDHDYPGQVYESNKARYHPMSRYYNRLGISLTPIEQKASPGEREKTLNNFLKTFPEVTQNATLFCNIIGMCTSISLESSFTVCQRNYFTRLIPY